MTRFARVGLALALAVGVGATAASAQPYQRTVDDTLRQPITAVSVESEYGSVAVSTWDRTAVSYRARIVSGQAQDIANQTRIEVDTAAGRLRLGSDFSDIEMRWAFGPKMYGYGKTYPEVHYTLVVPASTAVSLEGEHTRIRAVGLAHRLHVDVEGEPIDAGELVADMLPMEVNTSDPVVTVRRQRGPMRLDVEEGPVVVSGVKGDVSASLDEGHLTMGGVRGALVLDVEEGTAEVSIEALRRTTVRTEEGRIELTLPPDAGFRLSTALGEDATLRSTFDLSPIRDGEVNYRGPVRGGGPFLRIEADEGTVRLRSRRGQ